jgi:hypothetical protein
MRRVVVASALRLVDPGERLDGRLTSVHHRCATMVG